MLFDWVLKRRALVLLLSTAIVVTSSFGTLKLRVSPDNRVFYGEANEYFRDFREFEANYTSNDNILFVVRSSTGINNEGFASALRWITNEAWLIDHVVRIDSLATYPHVRSQTDTIFVTPLLDFVCPPDDVCLDERVQALLATELINRLLSEDLRSVGILATLSLELGAVDEIQEIYDQAVNLADDFRVKFPEYEIVFTGGIPMMAAFAEASGKDLSLLLPVAFLVIFLLLVVFLGGFRPTGILFGLGISAVLITLGTAGWAGHVINNATSIVPLIVFTLVITSSMHIILHFERNAGSTDQRERIIQASKAALQGNLVPVVASGATSIIGLLSLSFVDSPPLQQLGQLSALGVFVGCCLSIFVLPILLATFKNTYFAGANVALQELLNRYAKNIERGKSFALGTSAIFIIVCSGVFLLEIDDDFVKYFDETTAFRQNTDRATELLAGPNHIEVLVSTSAEHGVFDPVYLSYLKDLADYLRQEPHVSNVHSFYDVVNRIAKAFSPTSTLADHSASEIAQWFLVYELSLQQGQSNTDLVNSDKNQSRISVLLRETTSRDIQNLETDIVDWASGRGNQTFSITVTGENIPVAHLSEINIKSMIIGLGGSIFLTATVVGITFRKFRLGVAALVATLVPVVGGFGVWGWTIGTIGLASTAIVALTIGIVVDDAVHLSYRYLDATTRLNMGRWQSAAYSVNRAGTAVTTTSIVMVGGLSVLLFSGFEVNSSFGACTCLIICLALAFDLFVLPRVLVWTGR